MTLTIVVAVREGIVLASDSRITLNTTKNEGDNQIVQMAIAGSDSNNKLFLTTTNVGILCSGQADIKGVPIAGYIDAFMNEVLSQNSFGVEEVPEKILAYFNSFTEHPATCFLIAGYKKKENTFEPQIWEVNVSANSCKQINDPNNCCAVWQGEYDILTCLTNPMALKNSDGEYADVAFYPIEFNFFTLQDAIDFCQYAVKVTIDTMRFQTRAKTVGGPIDILVIKPNETKWIQRKQLHG